MENHWSICFSKAVESNKQLISSKNCFVAYLLENEPRIEMLVFKSLTDFNDELSLCFIIDKRSKLSQAIQTQSKLGLSFYFPLSREKFIFRTKVANFESPNDVFRQRVWKEWISQDERNEFTRNCPDIQKPNSNEEFNSQDVDGISPNFSVLVATPYFLERTLFKMPQVVADSRNQKFESEFKPYQKERKFTFSQNEKGWQVTEINP